MATNGEMAKREMAIGGGGQGVALWVALLGVTCFGGFRVGG